jgi:hypothetical protein
MTPATVGGRRRGVLDFSLMRFVQFLIGGHRLMSVLALALLGSAGPSGAQKPNCLEVKAQVSSDTDHVLHHEAWRALPACGDIEAGAITAVLRHAVPKSRAEDLARYTATALQDVRLLDSVRVLALDSAQSVDRRMFDLNLLIHYADPDRFLMSADTGAFGVTSGPFVSDGYRTIWGDEPPQEEDRAHALATIVRMGRKDPDPIVRRLAEKAAEELGYSPKKCPPKSILDLPAQWLCSALRDLAE